MKNIHVLATPNPSRLAIHRGILKYNSPSKKATDFQLINRSMLPQNIYITSDEEIKVGDYYLSFSKSIIKNTIKYGEIGKSKTDMDFSLDYVKKIILTTDQDLIADGVQAIDDEFLEWFVKNPSCDNVEVKCYSKFNDGDFTDYKIIIPKEEPKQETENLKNFKKLVSDEISPAMKDFIKEKQETLEEAKKKFAYAHKKEGDTAYEFGRDMYSFDKGAKWQIEQDKNKYSEEEVRELLIECCGEVSCEDGTLLGKTPDDLANWIDIKLKKK